MTFKSRQPTSSKTACSYLSFITDTYSGEDLCQEYEGIRHHKWEKDIGKVTVCCNKGCPQCAGSGCGKFTDASGNKLGAKNCCGKRILKTGESKICGSGGTKAPCVLPSDSVKKITDWLNVTA